MKSITSRTTLALLLLGLVALTGCETHELKDGAGDVVDVMRNGIDVITDIGNNTADAVKGATDKTD